jgi:hypothetical protein
MRDMFYAIGTSCQGQREVCGPGFLMIERVFYDVEDNIRFPKLTIPTDKVTAELSTDLAA